MANSEPDVLVAGAGPVGLFTALALDHHGISVRVVEEEWRPTGRSYALGLHPESLRLLGEVGLAEELVAAGQRVDVLVDYDGAVRRSERRVDAVPALYPFVLALSQGDLERFLVERLTTRCIPVEWNHRVAALEERGDRVCVDVQRLEKTSTGYAVAATEWVVQSVRQVRPRVLVGADGNRSTVRSLLQLDWDRGGSGDLYAVFEFEAEGGPPRNEARFTTEERGTSGWWPLPGGRWRWSVPLVDEGALRWRSKSRLASNTSDPGDVAVLERFLEARLPWFTGRPTRVHWITMARFERRTVPVLGRGRVWLAGDAAHVGGPLAMQSMNAGLREAATLAGCIASVVHGGAPVAILDEYGRAAHETWGAIAEQPILPTPPPSPPPPPREPQPRA